MAFGPLEFSLLREILGAFFLASGLPDTARNSCRCGDRRLDFQIKLLNVVRQMADLPDIAAFAWRPFDSEKAIARKILTALGGDAPCCNDTVWSLWLAILEQVRINAGLPDEPSFAFRFGDTRNIILAKILAVLNAAPIPIPPEPPFDECCPPPTGDWDFITAPAIVVCDFGFINVAVDCSVDWGTVP